MTSFIDTHCHLDKLDSTPEEAVKQAKQEGVETMVTISVDEESFDFVSNAVMQFKDVYGTVGVHPHDASEFRPSLEQSIRKLARGHDKMIAIGETGLDYHYMNSSRENQQFAFRKQLQIAVELNLPVVLHSREAEADTISILKEIPVPALGVAHSFTSSLKMARTLLDMGWYLGINGIVTFKNAEDRREVVRWIPLDRLLLETDSPFLAPVPFRGKPNKPANIPVIASFIAELRKISIEHIAEKTSENAHRLFSI
ncbi:MAG: TatD family hydrolase [SAR324 cluster bacterium]|nr:TatD family hydrolase [SAR324 cluster bacterium]